MTIPRAARFAATTLSLLLAAAVLAGCVQPTPTASASPSSSESAAPSPTVEPEPEAAVLEISLDGIDLLDSAGDVLGEAPFEDGAAVVAFVGDALGTTPEGTPNAQGYPITFYDWGDMSVSVIDDGPATVWVAAATSGGLELRTTEGVTVGMTRDDAIALGAVPDRDEDGDGLPDLLRLQVREAPGTESLENPGATGVDFILVILEGDSVVRMISPASDWGDL